jgi:hypothetical protein
MRLIAAVTFSAALGAACASEADDAAVRDADPEQEPLTTERSTTTVGPRHDEWNRQVEEWNDCLERNSGRNVGCVEPDESLLDGDAPTVTPKEPSTTTTVPPPPPPPAWMGDPEAGATYPGQEAEALDVTLDACRTDEFGDMVADVTIVNNSSERSNYDIEVAFTSPDRSQQYGTGWTYVTGLAPGQITFELVDSITPAEGEYVCEVISMDRLSDEGF